MMDKIRVLHAARRIAGINRLLNQEIDELLEAVGLTKKEVNDDECSSDNKEADSVVT